MKKFSFLLGVLLVVSVVGCSTIKGMGQDLKSLGNGIAGTSDKVKDGMSK